MSELNTILGKLGANELYQKYCTKNIPLKYVLVSGGPDSATVLSYVNRKSYGPFGNNKLFEIRGLFVNFGQPQQKNERLAAMKVCKNLAIKLETIEIARLSKIYKNKGELGYPLFREILPAVLGIVFTYALFNGANEIFHGGVQEDEIDINGTNAFFEKLVIAVNTLPGAEKIKLSIPFMNTPKSEVFEIAAELGLELKDTDSCITADGNCGKCRGCHRRKQAFENSDTIDLTVYKV